MTDLSDICTAIMAAVAGVTGITQASWPPPEQLPSGGVYGLLRPTSGTDSEVTSGRKQEITLLTLSIVTPLANLRTDMARVIDLRSPVSTAILNAGTLSGAVLQTTEIPWTFGTLDWGGQDCIGWRLQLELLAVGGL